MLHPYAQGKSLGLQGPSFGGKQLIDIPGRMAAREYDFGSAEAGFSAVDLKASGYRDDIGYPAVKMVFPAMLLDAAADVCLYR